MDITMLFFIAFCFFLSSINAAEWSYHHENGVEEWPGMYPQCGGRRQSPVNLRIRYRLQVKTFEPLQMNYGLPPTSLELVNTGHSAKVNVESTYRLTGGPLQAECTYKPVQFHFHWGSDASKGSEHTLKGSRYPMEMHIVHYDQKYESIADAMEKADGLAVIGVFFHLSYEANENLTSIIDGLSEVLYPNTRTSIERFPLEKLLPRYTNDYFFYIGSLTTPPCFQTVQWIVLKQSIPISPSQIDHFRALYSAHGHEHHMANNFRSIQPINERLVYTNNPAGLEERPDVDNWVR